MKTAGIVKLADNNYEIRVRAQCPRTGQRKEVRRVHEGTLTQARALQHQWREELVASLTEESRPERQRLKDFVPSWLAGRRGQIKGTTARKIAAVWDLQIVNTSIADLYVDDITIVDVERWLIDLRAKTYIPGKGSALRRKTRSEKSRARAYSAGTIKGYYRVLAQVLKIATARANVRNPCDAIERLKPGKRRKNFLGKDDVAGVLAHVREHNPEWFAAVLLDVLSGLRWGELSSLQWVDIDEAAGVIRVRRNNDKGTMIKSLKDGSDDDEPKLVPLLPAVADVLRERRQKMVADQHPGLAEGWIFPTAKGTLHRGSPLRDVLDAACAACATRRITPHGLRHTANDLLRRVAGGEVVRAIIGHSTPQMTHHYSHVDEDEKRGATARAFDVVTRGGKGVINGAVDAEVASTSKRPGTKNPAVTPGSIRGATQI